MRIIIGYTESDRAAGYSSYSDGYRPGARQETVEFDVDEVQGISGQAWAEAVFVSTNAPNNEIIAQQPGGQAVWDALADRPGNRAVSKGDTVTVDGVRYACASFGWEIVA